MLYSVVYQEQNDENKKEVISRVGDYWYGLLFSKEVSIVK